MKIKRRIVAICTAMTMFGTMASFGASADNSFSSTSALGNRYISYGNNIKSDRASARTYFNSDTTKTMASVTATYSYIKISNLKVFSSGNGTGSWKGGEIDFNVPNSAYRSVKIVSNHKVSHRGQEWSHNNITTAY